MKFANAVAGALMLMSLTACSDEPSDNDVQQAIRQITGDCKYLSITHVINVNWAVAGSPDYQVAIQYSVQTAPLPDAKNVTDPLKAPLADLDARMAAVGRERDKNFKANADFLDRIERAQDVGNETLSRSYENQRAAFVVQKLDPSIKLANDLKAKRIAIIRDGTRPLRDQFFKTCPKTSAAVYDRLYDNLDLEQYVSGHTMDFATSIHMVKSGKRWESMK